MNNIKNTNDLAPAITLMLFAPLIAEVLPGATRFSSIFVFPVEVFVWGGGALLIRYAVRRWTLPWTSMFLMALALAIAEECIIQQTSLAPMVIRLKGETYARAGGINYVYLLWALIYEVVFVVILPIHLVELVYPSRKSRPWISKGGMWVVIPLFFLGSLLAWFSWTHIARPKVFHLPVYTPPVIAMVLSFVIIIALIYTALSRRSHPLSHLADPTTPASYPLSHPSNPSTPASHPLSHPSNPTTPTSHPLPHPSDPSTPSFNPLTPPPVPPAPLLLSILAAIWAILLYGLVLLGFGIAPNFPPLAAITGGLLLAAAIPLTIPRWSAHLRWQSHHTLSIILGVLAGSMAISFIGFIGASGPDLYFKIIINIIAVILLIPLTIKINRQRPIIHNTN